MTALEQQLPIPVSTTFDVPGRTVGDHVGPAFGIVAWSAGTSAGIKSFGRQFVRGEMKEFSEVLAEAREVSLQRLVEHAQAIGGQAVIGVRFDSNTMGESAGLVEILAFGTAVTLTD